MRSPHLRIRDVHLVCLACRADQVITGPYDGPAIASWTAAHLRPFMAGWTVDADNQTLDRVERPLPPAVQLSGP